MIKKTPFCFVLFSLKIRSRILFCLLIERNLSRKSPSVVIGLYTESSRDFSQWFPAQELIMTSQARLVPHVDKAPLPLRILRLVTSNFLPVGFGAQLIGPIQLHVKGQISNICNFSRTLLGLFSVCEWQDLSFTYQKSEKTTYLDNLVFSASSVLWGTVKKSGLKSDPRQTLPGECAGESVTK